MSLRLRMLTGLKGWENQVPDIDIVINLAGATLNKRWTSSYKQTIMTSRIQSTESLVHLFEQRQHKPEVLLMPVL